MPPPQHIHANASAHDAGFNLVELVVAAALMMATTIAIIGVFNTSIFSLRDSNSRDAMAAAISTDLSEIERLNDNYACPSGDCSVQSLAPTKYGYSPSTSDPGWANFEALCRNTSENLTQNLVDAINQIPSPTAIAQGNNIVIQRTARLHPNNGSDRHLYIVEWTPPSQQGPPRQIVLSPSVAAWCP